MRRTSPTRATPTQSAMRRRRGGRAPVRAPASTWVASSARGDLALDAAAAVQPVGLVSTAIRPAMVARGRGRTPRHRSRRRRHQDPRGRRRPGRERPAQPGGRQPFGVGGGRRRGPRRLGRGAARRGCRRGRLRGPGEPRAGHRTHPPGDESPVRRLRPRRARARDSAFPWASRTTRTPPPSRSGGSAREGRLEPARAHAGHRSRRRARAGRPAVPRLGGGRPRGRPGWRAAVPGELPRARAPRGPRLGHGGGRRGARPLRAGGRRADARRAGPAGDPEPATASQRSAATSEPRSGPREPLRPRARGGRGGFGEAAGARARPGAEAARREALAPADSTLRVVPAELGADGARRGGPRRLRGARRAR